VPRVALKQAVDRGQVVRRVRGVDVKPDHAATRHTDIATVAARTPKAIVCLVSALEYHGLTTQVPHAVWIKIQKSSHRPTSNTPALRVVRAFGPALTTGIEKHTLEGVMVQMTTPAKTGTEVWINPPENRPQVRTLELPRDSKSVPQVSQSH